jgi:hypothetical protein
MRRSSRALESIFLPAATAANGEVPPSGSLGSTTRRRPSKCSISASSRRPAWRSTWRRARLSGAAVDAITRLQGAVLALREAIFVDGLLTTPATYLALDRLSLRPRGGHGSGAAPRSAAW